MKKSLILLALVIIAVVLVAPVFMPKQMKINTEKTYEFPINSVYEEFDNLKNYSDWNEWMRIDSAVKKEFYPPYKGKGAKFSWDSENEEVGKGTIEISESISDKKIAYLMKMEGWDGASNIDIDFEGLNENKTKIYWNFESAEMPYFYRYLNFFMKTQVENRINIGLENLVEKLSNKIVNEEVKEDLKPGMITVSEYVGRKVIGLRNVTSSNQKEINTAIAESLGTVKSFLFDVKKLNPESVGHPTVYWKTKDDVHNEFEFLCGYPITESVSLKEDDDFELFVIPSSKVILGLHEGSRDSINIAYNQMKEFAELNHLSLGTSNWEVYTSEKSDISDSQTKLHLEIK